MRVQRLSPFRAAEIAEGIEEYGYDKKEFVRRVVEQGNIEFTMED